MVVAGTERAVEVDDVQRGRAGGDERVRARDRIDVVGGLTSGIAAFEADAAPAAQIDRGDQEQRVHQAAMARKLSISRPPVRWLFSG